MVFIGVVPEAAPTNISYVWLLIRIILYGVWVDKGALSVEFIGLVT